MHLMSLAALIAPLVPAGRAACPAEADWMRAFALARTLMLGAAICALPPVLAAAPQSAPALAGVFAALIASCAFGLLALRGPVPLFAPLAALAGVAALALAPVPDDSAKILVAVCALTLFGDLTALPGGRGKSIGIAAAGLAILLASGLAALGRFEAQAEIWTSSVAVLAAAPLLTLAFAHRLAGERLTALAQAAEAGAGRGEALLAAADVAVLVTDRGGHVRDGASGAGRLLDCEMHALSGRGFIDRVLISDRPALLKAVSEAATAGRTARLGLRIAVSAPEAGAPRPPEFAGFDLVVRPFGAPECVAVSIARTTATPAAAAPQPDREALLRQIGHEIRTPMNAILGFSEVLVEAAVAPRRPEQVVDYARIIHRSAREAFAVSSALVEFIRAESAGSGSAETTELGDLAEAAARLVNERAPIPVRIERVARDVAVDADADACRTLLKTVLEAFSVAFDGRSQVLCQIARDGLAPVVSITARDLSGAAPAPRACAGHFAVMDALATRLSARIGAEIALDLNGATLTARILFPRGFTAARPAEFAFPLAKSA